MSKKHDTTYYTFIYTDEDGRQHRRRSYNMPPGYSPAEIAYRLKDKSGGRHYEHIAVVLEAKIQLFVPDEIIKNSVTVKRLYQAVSFYRLPNPYAVQAYRARKDITVIDRLLDECIYMKEAEISSMKDVTDKESELMAQIKSIKNMLNVKKKTGDEMSCDTAQTTELKSRLKMLKKELVMIRRIKKTEAYTEFVSSKQVIHVPDSGTYNNKLNPGRK